MHHTCRRFPRALLLAPFVFALAAGGGCSGEHAPSAAGGPSSDTADAPAPPGRPLDVASAALMNADRAFAADSRARGAPAWAAVWAERGRKEDEAVGGPAVAASVASMLDQLGPRFRWAPDTAAVLWPDSLGYTVGRWWIEADSSGSTDRTGRYLTVWTREAGTWRVALDLSLPPAEGCRGAGADDFDFWLGRWAVSQRFRMSEGAFSTLPARTTVTRAGPCAIVENWQGRVQYSWVGMRAPRAIRGASVRAWDPDRRRWRIYWMDSTTGAFGAPFVGAFADGVGEFLAAPLRADGPERRIRFTQERGAVRWELAIRAEGGGWTPLWTMEDTKPGG